MKSLNSCRNIMRGSGLLTVLFIVFAMAALFAIAGAAGTASAAPTSGCPVSPDLRSYQTDNNVSATFSNSGTTTTYSFSSLVNEHPVGGIPGLIKYCVYPSPVSKPTSITVSATGANGATWIFRQDPKEFAFLRPSGDKSNILLDGTTTVMGTATWTTLPINQTILLHINDPKVCASLYGGTAPTCFVLPSLEEFEGACIIGSGNSSTAYNAIPFGSENCGPPSVGVESYGFNELGDQVVLAGDATTPGRKLVALNVQFQSYACSVSGHWYSGDCVTNPGDTFDVPITANIYDSSACSVTNPIICLGPPLASVTTTQTIPYRPSADPTNCPDGLSFYTPGSQWFNPFNTATGPCQYSIGKVLTFDFTSLNVTLPDNVIWTVAYNNSHSGYKPIAQPLGPGDACESTAVGCPYDSLNVGIKSYTGAPYAGTDVSEAVVFLNYWQGNTVPQYPPPFGFGVLTPPVGIESTTDAIISSWIGFRPLGEIVTTP